ncbi:hypothetical protein [Streptomyces telluris]|uniref:Uncharacterized protein n=1 Tax=Streptomyces telluris TaxID=2720021 RepID=A0A9X2RMV7_9ACTN|nr:hypothetical protein [Streptomyces telluris]MCQ8771224.1 hypothetical protein [Streptomyces telluris]
MGFFDSVGDFFSDAYDAVRGGVEEAWNVVTEAANRLLGLPDFLACLLGIHPRKKLRLRVLILRDEHGRPLMSERDVLPAVELAKDVFRDQCNVRVLAVGGVMVRTLPGPAPEAALKVGCTWDAWREDFGAAGQYFRDNLARGGFLGYARPITVFIVCDVRNKTGCSLGPLTDYVTVDVPGMASPTAPDGRPRTLAHEVAHSCGLTHREDPNNLMEPSGPGTTLTGWQECVFRNSRHVTYL